MTLKIEGDDVIVMIWCKIKVVSNATSFADLFNFSSDRGQVSEPKRAESFQDLSFREAAAILRLATNVEAMEGYAGRSSGGAISGKCLNSCLSYVMTYTEVIPNIFQVFFAWHTVWIQTNNLATYVES